MWFYFSILLLGGPSPPSQLVPKQLKTVLPCKALGFSYGLITAVICGNWIFVLRSANEVKLPRKICCITLKLAQSGPSTEANMYRYQSE